MKTTVTLLLLSVLCFLLAGCATPAETAGAVAAVGASVVGIIEAVAPLLPPETLAKLHATANSIDGTVAATQTAVGLIADVITQFKSTVGDQLAQRAQDTAALAATIGEKPSTEEVYLISGGAGAGSTALSRLLSRFKHTPKAA